MTDNKSSLVDQLSEILNRHSAENESNTPDFILARYMVSCLDAYNTAVNQRALWHGGAGDLMKAVRDGRRMAKGSDISLPGS